MPYNPQQNGKAERMNRSLVEKAQAMINESGYPKYFWGEGIRVANYLINRSPSRSLDVTPAEIWYEKKPNVRNLRVFRCTAYSLVLKQFRDKFDGKTDKCIMIGYAQTGYRLWNLETNKVIVSRDVQFDENSFYFKINYITVEREIEVEENNDQNKEREKEIEKEIEKEVESENENETFAQNDRKRTVRPPKRYEDYEMYMAFNASSFANNVPKSYQELDHRHDKKLWLEAVKRELNSIKENETWTEVDKPNNAKILDTKWVFTYKDLEEKNELAKLFFSCCKNRKLRRSKIKLFRKTITIFVKK